MTAPAARPSPRDLGAPELAGYRVLRSLSHDGGAEVLLGHRSMGRSRDGETGRAPQAVALKVFPPGEGGSLAALRECAVLERARGDHVVDLLDLDADEESTRLVFERLPRGDLAELLRMRPRFDAGEAVTLLAPIVITFQRLHAAGVAHGGLGARTVMFRDDGSPALIGFSRAALFESGAPEVVLEQVDAVRGDRAAIRALAMTVLARVTGDRASVARQLHDDVDGCTDEAILPLLRSRLFEVAAATAVRFTPDEPELDAEGPAPRAVPVGAAVMEPLGETAARPAGAAGSRIAAGLSRVVPEALLGRVLDAVDRSSFAAGVDAVVRRWRAVTPARQRVAVAVAVAAVTVAVLTAVIPTPTAGTGAAAQAGDAPVGSPTPVASSLPDSTDADAEPSPADPAALDDPVAAALALMSERDRCLSTLSLRCLDRVDEPGSSALDDDRAAIRSAQQGGELPDPLRRGDDPPVLIERLGDSALVRTGQASGPSLLLVKGDEGWRIRDVVAAGGAGNPSTG